MQRSDRKQAGWAIYQTLDGADNGRTVDDRQRWKIVVHDEVKPRTEDA